MSSFYDPKGEINGVGFGIYHQDDHFKVHEYGYRAYRDDNKAMYPYHKDLKDAEKDLRRIKNDLQNSKT